jgi:Zn-dependent metalloprotease
MCTCKIIPDIVLEELKKEGQVILPRGNNAEDEAFRRRRAAALLAEPKDPLTRALGMSNRKIYNSNHTTTQRLHLVRSEGGAATGDVDDDKAYDNAGWVRKYYLNELGWHSIDDHGMDMIFNVHYGNQFNNAFWDGDDMTFGDGDGTNFIGFARALDVTGHELTHGVVQYTARLIYDGQPGALNEHMADVFGTVIKQYAKGQNEHTANWLMGDEIMGPTLAGRAIRSMKDPGSGIALSAQPDNMSHYYTGSADDHGVHINSGIPNKAFYLVAMSIGTFRASKLWFAALRRLKAKSNFKDLYNAVKASIPALVAAHTVPATTAAAVETAFHTVGIV